MGNGTFTDLMRQPTEREIVMNNQMGESQIGSVGEGQRRSMLESFLTEEGMRYVYPTGMKQTVGSPRQLEQELCNYVRSSILGVENFWGLVKSQYHFGQQMAGAFGVSCSVGFDFFCGIQSRTADLEQ
jgi:hypothetical protein